MSTTTPAQLLYGIDALTRAQSIVGKGGQYILGAGNYNAKAKVDVPWTTKNGMVGCDCSGFVCWCFKLDRDRPGFNRGRWATVSDAINTDSMVEDAMNRADLFQLVETPSKGDIIIYPGVRKDGKRILIGHVGLVETVPAEWPVSPADILAMGGVRPYHLVGVIHCKGPNGRKPGVIRQMGTIWRDHDKKWPKDAHRTRFLRLKKT